MFDRVSIAALAAQATLSIVGVEQFRRRVFPAVNALRQPEIVMDVWGPLSLVLPMLFFIAQTKYSVRGPGWMPIGAPVTCGVFALGVALVRRGGSSIRFVDVVGGGRLPHRALLACAGSGLFLLLLGAAHDLTLWMGHTAFLIAALLLWLNTPELLHQVDAAPPDAAQSRAGAGIGIALLCAIGQGLATLWISPGDARFSGAMMVATAAMSLSAAAVVAGPMAALRVGGWAAAYGVLFGIGLLSMARLLPATIQIVRDGHASGVNRIAFGFGAYAIEAIALLVMAGIAFLFDRIDARTARGLGWLIIIATALLTAWRLAAV